MQKRKTLFLLIGLILLSALATAVVNPTEEKLSDTDVIKQIFGEGLQKDGLTIKGDLTRKNLTLTIKKPNGKSRYYYPLKQGYLPQKIRLESTEEFNRTLKLDRKALKIAKKQEELQEEEDYIVKFEGKSITEKKQEIIKEKGKRSKNIFFSFLDNFKEDDTEIESEIRDYKRQLKETQDKRIEMVKEITGDGFSIFGFEIGASKAKERYLYVLNGISIRMDEKEAKEVRELDFVENVQKERTYRINLENTTEQIGARKVWNKRNITGEDIKIAVLDTGVDYTHPDLGDCTSEQFLDGKCSKVPYGYDFVNEDGNPIDNQGHGTHVAATAAGNGTLKGVAPGAEIYAYKVLDSGGRGTTSDIIEAIEWSVRNDTDIISMSLGGSGNPDDALSEAVDNAVDSGVVSVIAAGNSGPSDETIGSPGTARKAITVGAVDDNDTIASFSSRGPVDWENGIMVKPSLVAPGVDVCAAQHDDAYSGSECLNGDHISISGTSMATPHVSGAAALLLQKNPQWSPRKVKAVLMGSANNLGYKPTVQGTGRINLTSAFEIDFAVYPHTLNVTAENSSELVQNRSLTVQNFGKNDITLNLSSPEASTDSGKEDIVDFRKENLTIPSGSNKTVKAEFNMTGTGGLFEGSLYIEGDYNYSVPYIATRTVPLNISVVGKDVSPSYFVHDDKLKKRYFPKRGSNGVIDVEPFKNYTYYAVGEFEKEYDYILYNRAQVGSGGKNVVLNFSKAKKFNFKGESFSGTPLKLVDWLFGFKTYNSEKFMGVKYQDPRTGNRTVYVSKKPSNGLTTDIVAKIRGYPIE